MEKKEDNLIESDGISEDFFHLLYNKDELNFGPSINIPDTIIFKYGQPVTWYFTASNGKIKKKNRNNLLNARIEDCFTKNILGYDVIAVFISYKVNNDDPNAPKSHVIEYLNRKELQSFLYDRYESNNGILQKFIEPKGTRNEMIRAIWSPKVCLLERSVNIYQLHDHRYGLYERCVTYEGPEFYSVSAPLRGPVLAGQVQKLCEKVVSHISEVTFAQSQVSRIVLNLKVDSRDKLWLLYSTSIRCIEPPTTFGVESKPNTSLLNIDNVLQLPPSIHLNPNRSYEKRCRKVEICCISCGNDTLEDLRHPVPYKTIIKHYEHVLHLVTETAKMEDNPVLRWPPSDEIIEAAGSVGFGCLYIPSADDTLGKPRKMDLTKPLEEDELRIPPMIRFIHPKMSAGSFQRCRVDPLFLYKTVTVCENCFLVYSEFATMLLKLGHDLTKLFSSNEPVGVQSSTLSKSASYAGGSGPRPSSADWMAMSSVHRSRSSGSLQVSRNHAHAKDVAIGLRSQNPKIRPGVPPPIRNEQESSTMLTSYSHVSDFDGGMLRNGSYLDNNQSMISKGKDEDDIRTMVAERERHFFKEISKNPQLKDQHPLMHLITSQQKLIMADEQSGVLTSQQSMHTESLFGSMYGHQSEDSYDKYSAYKEVMSLTGSRHKHSRSKSRHGKNHSSGVSTNIKDGHSIDSSAVLSDVGRMGESSKKHIDFLQDTLQKITTESNRHQGEI
jgi:hypothetical protein